MTSSAATALRFHDLTLGYDRHPAVHHLNGVVEQGSLTAVVGLVMEAVRAIAWPKTAPLSGFDVTVVAVLAMLTE